MGPAYRMTTEYIHSPEPSPVYRGICFLT